MKKTMFLAALATTLFLTACGSAAHLDAPVETETIPAVQEVFRQAESNQPKKEDALEKLGKAFCMPVLDETENLPQDSAEPESFMEEEIPAEEQQPETTAAPVNTETETQPEAPQPTPAPTAAPAAPAPASAPAYGAIPFDLAAATGTWWAIDSTDSAYWAVQENINAMRAAGGLPALSMNDSLSSIASSRCQSFVMGGPFDHSGMVTRSEICAAGPLGSASAVCSAWQNSEAHYANMMRSDISSMGVGCWFCEIKGNRYTYWTVTFE